MIRFSPTIPDDLPEIEEWIAADPDHAGKRPAAWMLKGSVLNCCAEDDSGPVMYLRIDKEDANVRVHIQFAPIHKVGKRRVAAAFMDGLPRMGQTMKNMGYGDMVFESTSASLIAFMGKMGFVPNGGNDYVLRWA